MTTAREEELFLQFKRRPTRDALTRLLLGYQDHIYNLCFQVLRHPEDAEDVSQQVLIETAGGVAKVGSPRQFKVWLYKVALHAALKLKETRARRVELARRLATPASTGGGDMDSEERVALMRAIGDLDDRTRCILLEHYFDKLTLDEIGAREGVSSVAIWKRLDRAKETLRRSLAGLAVAPLLDSISPVAAPAGFAAKAAIAGGVVVGTKSAISAGTVVAAILLVGAASTGGYFVGASRAKTASVMPLPDRPVTHAPVLPSGDASSTAGPVAADPPASPLPSTTSAGRREEDFAKGKTGVYDPAADTSPVKYGRYGRARANALMKAATWDEFYRTAREQEVGQATFEEVIFQRVTKEMGIDVDTAQSLRELFESEREAATKYVVENSGGAAEFQRSLKNLTDERKDDWRRQREVIRETFRPAYLKILTYEQLQLFNEHLRNSEIGLEAGYAAEGRHFLIIGVGRK